MKRLLLLLIGFLLTVCCSTRLPEEPSVANSSKVADRLENLFYNMQLSIRTFDNILYMQCFSETAFVYRADYLDSLNYPVKLADWGREEEEIFITNFYNQYSDSGNLQYTDFVPNGAIDEQDTLFENVLLKIPDLAASLRNPFGVPEEIRALVDLVIKKGNDDLYYIYKWTERRSTVYADSLASWASFKVRFVN